jgi:MYXO-CTERM domain-containing protein
LRCATACLEGNVCPSGFACRNGQCLRAGGLSTGERCLGPDDCASALCAVFAEPWLNYCTKPCSTAGECGNGFDCKQELGAQICVPAVERMGESCIADSQCTSDNCHPTLGLCTRQCNPQTAPCPPGFLCHVVDGELACVPGAAAFPPDGGAGAAGAPDGSAGSAGTGSGGTGGNGGSVDAGGGSGGAAGGAVDDDGGSSGCGCRTARARSEGAIAAMFALGLGIALRVRRRRGKLGP